MRAIVGREGLDRLAASSSQMGRFETEWLADRGQPGSARRSVRRLDRPGARSASRRTASSSTWTARESPTYGAAGRLGLQRPLRLHLLPPAVRVQPVRRSRALRPAARQRAQRRRLARGAGAGDRTLPRARPPSTSAATRRSPSPSCTSCWKREGIGYAIRLPANPVLQEQIGHLLKRPVGRPPNKPQVFYASFTLSGAELEQAAPCRGQGRVAPGRAVPAGRLHRHQPDATCRSGLSRSTTAWHG